jgi:hypothetical protein
MTLGVGAVVQRQIAIEHLLSQQTNLLISVLKVQGIEVEKKKE